MCWFPGWCLPGGISDSPLTLWLHLSLMLCSLSNYPTPHLPSTLPAVCCFSTSICLSSLSYFATDSETCHHPVWSIQNNSFQTQSAVRGAAVHLLSRTAVCNVCLFYDPTSWSLNSCVFTPINASQNKSPICPFNVAGGISTKLCIVSCFHLNEVSSQTYNSHSYWLISNSGNFISLFRKTLGAEVTKQVNLSCPIWVL